MHPKWFEAIAFDRPPKFVLILSIDSIPSQYYFLNSFVLCMVPTQANLATSGKAEVAKIFWSCQKYGTHLSF
jgi:hypothetical protein